MSSDKKRTTPSTTEELSATEVNTGAVARTELEAPTPSWFAPTYTPESSGDLADRYRAARVDDPILQPQAPEAYEAYRRGLEERFQSAKRMANSPVPTLATMDHDAPPRRTRNGDDDGNKRFQDWQRKVQQRNSQPVEKRHGGRLTPFRIVGLFAGACTIGGLAGFGSANLDDVSALLSTSKAAATAGMVQIAAYMPRWEESQKSSPNAGTVLTKKPIKMARVAVADAAGVLNIPIPLDIAAFPADPEVPLALKITGLPADAYLTQGREVAAGEWLLKPAEIDGVKLIVPQADAPQLELAVAAVEEKSGSQATPPQEMMVELDLGAVKVLPANAPPEAQTNTIPQLPAAIPLPQEVENSDAKSFFSKADALLKTGDLVSARQYFIKAHGLGLAEAAYGAGQTFDPIVYAAMNVHGLQADKAKALDWYQKAANAGHLEALKAIETLNAAVQP